MGPKVKKASGTCKECLATRKLHSGGLVHLHGHRGDTCPGSNCPPLERMPGASGQVSGGPPPTQLPAHSDGRVDMARHVVDSDADGSGIDMVRHVTHGPLLRHICKGAREACAQALTSTLLDICKSPQSIGAWTTLFDFAPSIFANPSRAGKRRNMTKTIKCRTVEWLDGRSTANMSLTAIGVCESGLDGSRRGSRKGEGALLAAVNAKLEDGNIRAAVRILCDGGQPAEPNEHNLGLLRERHPLDPDPEALRGLPAPEAAGAWQVTPAEVLGAVRSFPSGSAGGPDGFRPGHLLDLVGFGDACGPLVEALTDFMNLLLRGGCPAEVRPILFGGNMIALCKDNGGLRPIAVGYIWRRLAANCANRYAVARLTAHFAPLQLGIGVPGGCEAAVHATRRFASSMGPDQVLVKLDFANAFNTLRRDVMLKSVLDIIPELYPFVHQAYSTPSVLKFGDMLLSSQMGPQQGDPLGPLLFSLPLQPVLHSLESVLRVGFLDDLTLGGEIGAVSRDVDILSGLGLKLGLCLNPSKCEVLAPGFLGEVLPGLSGYPRVEMSALTLLGAPLFHGVALDGSLGDQCEVHRRALDRMRGLPTQNALVLLRSSFGASRLNYLLRCSPCFVAIVSTNSSIC